MVEQLRDLIINGEHGQARALANELFMQEENSVMYWILNATLFGIEGNRDAELACISRGLQQEYDNYELYFMLGNYYFPVNHNQAYLCYEQAAYYCTNEEDLAMIRQQMEAVGELEDCNVRPASIVILSYNIKDVMIGCIESIRNTCPKEAYEIVVVDNASTDGVTEWLKVQDDIVLQCNTENAGFAAGCNQGIALANPKHDIMLLNNDTIMPPNALFWLRMGLYVRETVGAVGPLTNYAGNDQQLADRLDSVQAYIEIAKMICVPTPNSYENKLWLVGFAMLIRRKAVDEVGGLDTRFGWGNYEDNDYGMKLTQGGYELLLCYNSFVFHYGSLNMSKDKAKYMQYMKKNEKLLKEKWGFDVSYYSNARVDLIEQMRHTTGDVITVLEIGCGCGSTLSRIKYYYPNATVYGIELMENVVKYGRHLAEIIPGNIETMEIPYEKGMFDYIICGDVIEHLHDPATVLLNLKQYLKPDGRIIASIPNLMNITVVADLLRGNFTYKDAGILDQTHLHFFTKNEINKMFIACGYQVEEIKSRTYREDIQGIDEKLIEAIYRLPGIAPTKEFETYQYLVTAKVES